MDPNFTFISKFNGVCFNHLSNGHVPSLWLFSLWNKAGNIQGPMLSIFTDFLYYIKIVYICGLCRNS
jgi:hypothetical protein